MRDDHDNTVTVTLLVLMLLTAMLVSGIARGIGQRREARRDQRLLDAAVRRSRAWDDHMHRSINRFLEKAARP